VERQGLTAAVTLVALAGGLMLLAAFAAWERQTSPSTPRC
jgi:hypothetical protein